MAKYRVTGPDGATYEINAPDGASEQDVLNYAQQNFAPATAVAEKPDNGLPVRPDRSALSQAARLPGLGAKGIADSALETLAIPGELTGRLAKLLGMDITSGPGGPTQALKNLYYGAGRMMAEPIDAAIQSATGGVDLGPMQPENTLERGVYGAGRGAVDAATMLVPAAALAKGAQAGGMTQRVAAMLAEAPKTQMVAGMTGGAVSEMTDSPGLGIAAAMAVPLGAQAGKSAVESVLQRQLDRGTSYGARKVNDLVSEMGGGDFRKGLTAVQDDMARMGPDTALVDVLGIRGQRLARGAASVPGGADEAADAFVRQRMAGRGERLRGAVSRTLADGEEFRATIDDLMQRRAQSSAPLYDEAFNVKPVWDNRLDELIKDPLIQQGAAKGIRIQQIEALAEGKPFNPRDYAIVDFNDAGDPVLGQVWNLRTLDAAKRGLDEIIESAKDSVTGKVQWNQYLRAVDKLRGALVTKLDDLTGGKEGLYAQARAAYAGPSKMMDAANMGRRFINGDAEITERTLAGLADDQKEAFRIGSARALNDLVNSDTQAAVTRLADKKEGLWNKIRAVYPDEQSFNTFKTQVQNEIRRAQTERFISPRAGSQTAALGQDISALSDNAGVAVDAAQSLAQGRPTQAALGLSMEAIRRLGRRMAAPNPERSRELGELLMTTDPKKLEQIMMQLQDRRLASEVLPMLGGQPGRAALPAGISPLALSLLPRNPGQ